MQDAIILGDRQSHLLAKMMELSQERQQVISHNLANTNTPGYIRQDVDFSRQLADLVRDGTAEDFAALRPRLVEDRSRPATRLDGNNVEAAGEMGEMMQNGILYELLARAFSTRASILRMAIDGAKS
ncbi:MAG: flagellar basal body rod protein FlgB [Lentisphaeria bacterium]|jgi:flagellar basal-body rod protein FlgB|nr:flagellar basal body rod protein FlgB [Lentisphaeria bacterium]